MSFTSVMTTLGADVVKFDDHQDGFNPVFRKTLDLAKTPIESGKAYALFRLPVGFMPRNAMLYVENEIADSDKDFIVHIGTKATVEADSGQLCKVAINDIDDAGDCKAGTFASATTTAASTTYTTTLTAPIVAGSTAVYGFITGEAVSKGKLEIVISGDQMLTPAKAF